MTSPTEGPPRASASTTPLLALTALAAFAAALLAAVNWWRTAQRLDEQAASTAALAATLAEVHGELTMLRIEQSAEGAGPVALLEKLAVYAPLTSNARVPEPDYQEAKKRLAEVVRAFEALGKDEAWRPVVERLEQADVKKDFDEIKWLLEIALRLDPPAGKQIAKEMLLGQRKPYPRLRWWAAELLLDHDRELAQQLLRQVLLTETSRGIDVNRAGQYGMTMPDPAAYATTGFNNFVQLYIRSEDPDCDDTLMMVLGRVEHDRITIQDCIKELGRRRCAKAAPRIKQLYDDPPLNRQDPIFLGYCAQAIAEIEGAAARPWLEEKLRTAPDEVTANKLRALLDGLR